MLASPSSSASKAGKQRMEAEREEKEQLSSALDTVHATQRWQQEDEQQPQSAVQKRRLLVRRVVSHSPLSASTPSPLQPATTTGSIPPQSRRHVVVVRRANNSAGRQPVLPPLSPTSHSASSVCLSPHVPAAIVPSASQLSIRERRILSRVSASSSAFSSFQSRLASRVSRSPALLCMTNAADEWRVRMERAAINEQEKRIARQAAAAHIDAQLTVADSDGGLPLPWEQSLRGATVHSVGVGGLFSGLYCKITQADMSEMEIVRSVKLIEEQPALSTQAARAGRGGGRSVRSLPSAASHHSVAAIQLMDEAARLQQLSRLGTLGRKEKAHRGQQSTSRDRSEVAEERGVDEATLRLGDLIVRGTPLFDNINPPPQSPTAAATGAAASEHRSAADHTADSRCADSDGSEVEPVSFQLSRSYIAFQQTHFPHVKQSAHVTLHNSTRSTLHFALSRVPHQSAFEACSPPLPARSSFILSHPVGYVLPLTSIDLCVTFSPPASGVWLERWQLTQTDHDGESQPVAAATVTLTGTSHPTPPPHNHTAVSQHHTDQQTMLDLLSTTTQQSSQPSASHTDGLPSSATGTTSDAELRSAFCSANSSRRLHFHRWMMPQWWRLWNDVRQLHRPLHRQTMEWKLSAQHIQHAIEQLPSRHTERQSALTARLNELQALAAVIPAPHPARLTLLASLMGALVAALPPFASQLRLLHKHTLSPPWEDRARSMERQLMEVEDSTGHMTDPLSQQAAIEQRIRLQRHQLEQHGSVQQQLREEVDGTAVEVEAELSAEVAQQREEAARVCEDELRADAEWRQRHSEYTQRLEEESRRVVVGVIGAFEACAGVVSSDQPPPDADQQSCWPVQLPVTFPSLVIEPEQEAALDRGKGKAVKARR